MKCLVNTALVIGLLVASPGCRKDGRQSDKDDRQSEAGGKQAKEADEQSGRYEAKSEFTMDVRRPLGGNGAGVAGADMDGDAYYVEIFNSRLSDWRSEAVFTRIVQQYRASYPNSQVTDKELHETLKKSRLEPVRHSRLITIAVRSASPELAAALANAYAEAIKWFTDKENEKRCDRAVAEIREQVERQKRADDELAMKLLAFQVKNKIDVNGPKDMRVEASLKQLKQEKEISSAIYQSLLLREKELRLAAEQNNEIIRVARPAQIPTKPLGRW